MSKKSRRRNKKILAMLALAGGATMLGRRKKASIADIDDAGLNVTHSALTDSAPVVKKVVAPVDTAPVITGAQEGNTRLKRGGVGPMESVIANRLTAGNRVPPSMRGRAPVAEGYQRRLPPNRTYPGGWTDQPFKGGGIAKRGSGVALKHGGRVKSMGIAKRGGGIAKK